MIRQLFTGSVADMSRPPTTLCNSSTLAEELALGPAVAGFIVIPFHLFVFFTSSSSESLRGKGFIRMKYDAINREEKGITTLLRPDKAKNQGKRYLTNAGTCPRKSRSFSWTLAD